MTRKQQITIAHSPDADDAFMFYGLAAGHVGHPDIAYTHVLRDIQTLNESAREGRYAVTALSVHAYAYVSDRYALLRSGASMGEADYGPMVVARSPMKREVLRKTVIAIPGSLTTATLLLHLAFAHSEDGAGPSGPPLETIPLPFDQILPAVVAGKVAAGLLIHEGQLTYAQSGLVNVLPLYTWWHETYHLPMPLGVNGIRRDLDPLLQQQIARDLRASIEYGLAHREAALTHAARYADGMAPALIDRFVGMYVNHRTVAMGDAEATAIATLLDVANGHGLIPARPSLAWVG
ncbi:MAG: ABC transporter substrate-binding protein [Deltaproteobacteria bacterium]|nr:ABC transporter substrate-binding protein [Deltaproteobacteria bacterium]